MTTDIENTENQNEAAAQPSQCCDLLTAMPPSGKRVIIFWLNGNGLKRTSMGFYAKKYTIDADNWEHVERADYCEEKDQYFCPEGWHEEMWEAEYFYPIQGKVVGWQEVPRFPGS